MSKEKNIFVSTGISYNNDPYEAGKEAVETAIRKLDNKIPQFGIVFASAKKYGEQKKMEELAKSIDEHLKKLNPQCKWVGSSSVMEISDYGYTTESVVIMLINSEFVHFGVGISKNVSKNPLKSGEEAAKNAIYDVKIDRYLDPYLHFNALQKKTTRDILTIKPYIFLSLFPGLGMKYFPKDNQIFKGIIQITGSHIFCGADASDNFTFTDTYIFANGKAYTNTIALVCIISNLKINIGVQHGYQKTKKIVIITKAKDNIVYEFNNRPAAVVYSELTGAPLEEMRKNMLTFLTKNPLGIADIEGNYWLNCPYAVVEDTALAFFEPPPDDAAMAIMESTKKEILKSVKESIHLATYGLKDISTLIVFSCAAHLLYLEKDIVEEYKLIRKLTGKQPFIGFSTYAEHATIPTGSVLKHGYTFACLGITNRLISD